MFHKILLNIHMFKITQTHMTRLSLYQWPKKEVLFYMEQVASWGKTC